MRQLVIEDEEQMPVTTLRLVRNDYGDITLVTNDGYNILSFDKEGKLFTYGGIPNNLGIAVNKDGYPRIDRCKMGFELD